MYIYGGINSLTCGYGHEAGVLNVLIYFIKTRIIGPAVVSWESWKGNYQSTTDYNKGNWELKRL